MIKINSIVLCRYYNTPDRRFYGESFTATVKATNNDITKLYLPARSFLVERIDDKRLVTVNRKEIKKIITA